MKYFNYKLAKEHVPKVMGKKHDFWHMFSLKTFSTIIFADSQHPPFGRKRTMNNILSTLNHAALIGLLCMGAVSAQAENKITKTIISEYPPLGRMIDIGGRKLQLDCRGSGSPTVVFEAGLDTAGSLSWALVHDEIAQTTRACAYSRAGIMWSDPQDGLQNGKAVAEDLHTLLSKAGEQGPFVLVGHSLGGPYSMTYTKYFGEEVAGLVFVDASHPDQEPLLKTVFTAPQSKSMPPITEKFKRKLKSAIALSDGQITQLYLAHEAYVASSELATTKEFEALTQTLAEAGTFRQLGNRPIFVLTATAQLSAEQLAAEGMTAEQDQKRLAIWKQLQADMATWSSNSQHQYVEDSTHYIQFNRPDMVIAAVQSVVGSVRTGKPTAPVAYDEQTQKLYCQDVIVNGSHYQAELQQKNGQFVLESFSAAPMLFSAAARFDTNNNVLSVPLAEAGGQNYQATFKHLGNGVFTLQTLTPR